MSIWNIPRSLDLLQVDLTSFLVSGASYLAIRRRLQAIGKIDNSEYNV